MTMPAIIHHLFRRMPVPVAKPRVVTCTLPIITARIITSLGVAKIPAAITFKPLIRIVITKLLIRIVHVTTITLPRKMTVLSEFLAPIVKITWCIQQDTATVTMTIRVMIAHRINRNVTMADKITRCITPKTRVIIVTITVGSLLVIRRHIILP
jgi:hypothetical protein